MNREQAINYLICRGFTHEQVGEVVRALTYKPRDCANCKHYIVKDTRTNWGSQETTKIYGCECWECEYEPTTKNDLGVEEVTALAEWTEKLTKECEEAYNKGYADGKNEQKPKTGHWIEPRNDDGMSDPIYYQVRCSECGFDLDPQTWHVELHQYNADKYCPNCGARMVEPQESKENKNIN